MTMSDPNPVQPPSSGPVEPAAPNPARPASRSRPVWSIGVAIAAGLGLGYLLFHTDGTAAETATGAKADDAAAAEPEIWTCSMHPQVRQHEPGMCPLCAMELVRQSSLGATDTAPNRVVLSERARALARIRTAEVRRANSAGVEVFLAGRVDADETTLRTVTSWVAGRIERLDVRATGESVAAQQVVAAVFSADLIAAQQDMLVAERQAARLAGTSDAARQSSDAMIAAARTRLELLGMSRAEIERVAKAGKVNRLATVRSSSAGTVIERMAAEGAWVEAGGPLVRLADLSKVWVLLDAYERDLGRLAVGQKVRFTVEALPGEHFSGDITFIDPTVDRERRTARVRVAVDNSDGRLRPGLAVQASIEGVALVQAPLVVPVSAPLFTGRRSVVYVEINTSDGPAYEARVVRLGQRIAEGYPVIAGIEEGQRVVVHGAFVIDADLQLRGGESMMTLADDREVDPATEPVPVKAEERKAFAPVIEAYLALQRALAADDLGLAITAARTLSDAASGLRFGENPLLQAAWVPLGERIAAEAARVVPATSLESARGPFEPISHAVERVLVRFGNPLDRPVAVAFCPMARDGSGARWVQAEGEIDNAYYGAVMRKCGEIRALVPADGLLVPPAGEGKSQ